jgi:hypothetical protein
VDACPCLTRMETPSESKIVINLCDDCEDFGEILAWLPHFFHG